MIEGIITKGIGGFYSVYSKDNIMYTCFVKGRLRKDKITPLIGDHVELYPPINKGNGIINAILPRKNSFIRPPIANVDQFIIVISPVLPLPNYTLLDKLLIQARQRDVDVLICVNKIDLITPEIEEKIKNEYTSSGCSLIFTSTLNGVGIMDIKSRLCGKITTFTGQSGVGKTSLLNYLIPEYHLKTGEISVKIGGGKHTTRHIELLLLPDGGMIMDTPGFSLLNIDDIEPVALNQLYPEFEPYANQCRFHGCLHEEEPDCIVRKMVFGGKISSERYKRYLLLLKDIKKKWRNKYD